MQFLFLRVRYRLNTVHIRNSSLWRLASVLLWRKWRFSEGSFASNWTSWCKVYYYSWSQTSFDVKKEPQVKRSSYGRFRNFLLDETKCHCGFFNFLNLLTICNWTVLRRWVETCFWMCKKMFYIGCVILILQARKWDACEHSHKKAWKQVWLLCGTFDG